MSHIYPELQKSKKFYRVTCVSTELTFSAFEEVTLGSHPLILTQPFVKAFWTLSLKLIFVKIKAAQSIHLLCTFLQGLEGQLYARVTNINESLIS